MMNERIEELAKQAGAYWHHGDFNMGSSVEFQESDLEKFAELIIKECAKKVADFRKEDEEDEYVCHSASEVIKRHFGVE